MNAFVKQQTSQHWRTSGFVALLAAVLLVGSSAAWAGGRHHHPHHGYRGHSSIGWGVGFGYPSPYWRGYGPAWGYPGGSPWGPAYGPAPFGSIGLGFGSGRHHSSWGIGLSLPLYVGPRYRAPVPSIVVPAARPVARQPVADCLQVREYQTEIEIDGRWVPAYGQACLQADGSWKMLTAPLAAD